jgi:hypothetical protein
MIRPVRIGMTGTLYWKQPGESRAAGNNSGRDPKAPRGEKLSQNERSSIRSTNGFPSTSYDGGHVQAPLLRGARYAGLTQRQSQAAFSYMAAPQNWQAIPTDSHDAETIPGHISR